MKIKYYIKEMRVHHYIKNLLVFVPLACSGQFFIYGKLITSIYAFLSFCFISSAIYFINDIRDIEKDRNHPTKCNRPIAAGQISVKSAIVFTVSGVVLYTFKRITKERYKEKYFSFLKFVSVNNQLLNEFWSANNKKVKDWYLNQKANSDVVISASPEFLLQPICNKLSVSLIASKVDPSTGQFAGKNCHGQEKIKRFTELYPNETIDEFYTDSKSDYPFAALATKAYMVKKDEITELRFGIKNEEDYN